MSELPTVAEEQCEKPPASASVFARAGWYLYDYAMIYADWCFDAGQDPDLAKGRENHAELLELARRLRELDGQWEEKREAGSNASAAEIIAEMLAGWKLPGAVYWSARARRWRVVGSEYQPQRDDVMVGVYAPGVDAALLLEDLDAVAKPADVPPIL